MNISIFAATFFFAGRMIQKQLEQWFLLLTTYKIREREKYKVVEKIDNFLSVKMKRKVVKQ